MASEEVAKKGIKVLTELLYYASIEITSQWLIHVNIVRLAVIAGDTKMARNHLMLARRGNHSVTSEATPQTFDACCYLSHYPTIDFPRYFTVIKGKFLTLTAPVE